VQDYEQRTGVFDVYLSVRGKNKTILYLVGILAFAMIGKKRFDRDVQLGLGDFIALL
jgi:hypothetical protein